jgi:hypothetical protein
MKKSALFALALLPSIALAGPKGPAYDVVKFPVQAKTWVKTQTANVIVMVNATVKNTEVVSLHSNLMNTLNQIAKGDWHVTDFSRNPDNSGLEKVNIRAQARLASNALKSLEVNAKKISRPGVTYKIADVLFQPSFKDVRKAKSSLRMQIYKQTKNELKRLSKVFPGINFRVYSINFMPYQAVPGPANRMMAFAKVGDAMTPVQNQLTQSAVISLKSAKKKS